MEYKILQLDREVDEGVYRELIFREWSDEVEKKFDLNNYAMVHSGEIEVEEGNEEKALEKLFVLYNTKHPEGFKGHSLSVSDVVKLGEKVFYCDFIGWREIK